MKRSIEDYLYFVIIICFVSYGAFAGTAYVAAQFTKPYLGDYHVIFDFFLFLISYGVLAGAVTRGVLVIFPIKMGEFDINSPNLRYWKSVIIAHSLSAYVLIPFRRRWTMRSYYRFFGAKIGNGVGISGEIQAPWLVSIGDNTIIGHNALISGDMMSNGKIFFGEVRIGKEVTIGTNAIIMPDVEIGDNAVVSIASVVFRGTRIPAGENWRGNPARKWQ